MPAAKTLVLAALREGVPQDRVWVGANDGSLEGLSVTFLDGAEPHLLWHRRSLARLGIPAGIQRINGSAQAIAPSGAMATDDDGNWVEVEVPPVLAGLPLYDPPDNCRLLSEGIIEPWPEVPPFINAARTGPTSVLLGGEDGRVYHFSPASGAEVLADLGARVMAVAYDGAGRAYALDAGHRLHTMPLEGGSATVLPTSTAALGHTNTSTWTLAQLAVQPAGEVHVLTQYLDTSSTPALFDERVARRVGSTWRRWNEPECGPEEARRDDGYTSHRIAATGDGSVVAVGVCRRVVLRWRDAWGYEFVLNPTVVRELRGRTYVGTKNGGVFDDRNRSGEWGSLITAGGRGIQDLAEAPLDGILVAEFNNAQTVTKVVFPPLPGEVAPQLCPLANVAWPGSTTELLQLGADYLVRTVNPPAVWHFTLGEVGE